MVKPLLLTKILITTLISSGVYSQNIDEEKIKIDPKYAVSEVISKTLYEKELSFVASPFLADFKFDPQLKHFSSENESEDMEAIIEYKKKNQRLKGKLHTIQVNNASDFENTRAFDFEVTQRMYGDIDGACPNDNTIAVGKNGKIISMMNGEVGIFNTNGSKLAKYNLFSFFNSKIGDPCDPLVQYDFKYDRYIMFVQACGNYKDKIAFGFSATNDPAGNWNIYLFDSDALGDGSWSDYPKMAITRDEAFVSLNLFGQDGKYRQSILYQLDKVDGFNGNALTYKIWDKLEFTPMPLTSGVVQYYPGAYILSSESGEGSSLTLYDVTNNLGSSDLKIVKYNVPVEAYKVPTSASQFGTTQNVDSGDSRMQSGYYQNSTIHAVHTVSDAGYGAIKYYRINPDNLTVKNFTITAKDAELDYCYPALSPFTKDGQSDEAFVAFHATGIKFYPSIRGKVFNHDFTTLPSQEIKSREGAITSCYNEEREYNRWGDYMGIAYHHGSTIPKVWIAGSLSSNSLGWVTYLAEASAIQVNSSTNENIVLNTEKIYPNPTSNRIEIFIDSKISFEANFILQEENGSYISAMYKGGILDGENKFSFDVSSLPNGIYYLQIKNNQNEVVKSHKVAVIH